MKNSKIEIEGLRDLMEDANADVAAGLKQSTINDFLISHYNAEESIDNSVYKGEDNIADIKVNYSYHIQSPATIDLAPFTREDFSKMYIKWIKTVPELSRFVKPPKGKESAFLKNDPPPNVKVNVNNIKLSVAAKPENSDPIDVNLYLNITVAAFVESLNINGNNKIRLTPISIIISDKEKFFEQVDQKLSEKGYRLTPDKDGDSKCADLKRLIIYIANQLLSLKIGLFVKEFNLPTPIDVFDGISISSISVKIIEDILVTHGRVIDAGEKVSAIRSKYNTLQCTKQNGLIENFKNIKAVYDSIRLTGKAKREKQYLNLDEIKDYPQKGVFLIINKRLLQMLADKYLNYYDDTEDCGDFLKIFKGCWDCFIRSKNPKVDFDNHKVIVSASVKGGGGGRICIETHCGDSCIGPKAKLSGRAKLAAIVKFKSEKEIWIDPRLISFPTKWDVDFFGWPFDEFIEYFLDAITAFAMLVASIWAFLYEKKIASLPEYFPGTSLKYDANFNKTLVKIPGTDALMALGDLKFK